MKHNEFAISLVPKSLSGVNCHGTGVLVGLVILFMVLSVMTLLNAKPEQTMAKTYPVTIVAQAN